jgi:3-keto-disaccharide hydrolase
MKIRTKSAVVIACGLAMLAVVQGQVQQQPPPPPTGTPPAGGGQGRRGGGSGRGGAPIPFDNFTGFDKIFDGATLANWDGDPAFWRVERGAIVGETTPDKPLSENTFLIYRGSEPDNFELKLEFRMNSTNSGVQYRSRQLTGAVGKWVLCGYQADIDFDNSYTGMLYEERGRPGFLAPRGTVQYAGPNDTKQGQCSRGQPVPPRGQGGGRAGGGADPQRAGGPAPAAPQPLRGQIGQIEDGEALRGIIKVNDWNQFHVIARGNTLIHLLNGHVTAVFVDDDQANRSMKGLIGVQLHVGAPMKIEFRNIYLKNLK